jgi:hypothetical protein
LSSYLDNTDNQTISLTGNTLTLGNGTGADTTADLSGFLDNTDAQDISTNGSAGNISIANGSTLTLNVNDADSDATNELQSLNQTGTNVTLSNGGGSISVADNDNDSSNELQNLSISGNTISLSNGGGSVSIPSETTTNLSQNVSSGDITYTNEAGTNQTAKTVSTDVNNGISVGTDGGAYYRPMVRAMGKVNSDGNAAKILGATVGKINTGDYQVTFNSSMPDANYIIQLTVRDFNNLSRDDPGIQYINQTTNGFQVHIQNNDDGNTNGTDTDFEFMFTVFDF